MDRNITSSGTLDKKDVATREGGLDRNGTQTVKPMFEQVVATREGGVDRNGIFGALQTFAERHRPQGVAQIKTTYPKSAESFR